MLLFKFLLKHFEIEKIIIKYVYCVFNMGNTCTE